jgi:hypothetical protein
VEVTAAGAAAAASSSGGAGAGVAPAAGGHGDEAIGGLVMRTPVCRYRGGRLRNLLVGRGVPACSVVLFWTHMMEHGPSSEIKF